MRSGVLKRILMKKGQRISHPRGTNFGIAPEKESENVEYPKFSIRARRLACVEPSFCKPNSCSSATTNGTLHSDTSSCAPLSTRSSAPSVSILISLGRLRARDFHSASRVVAARESDAGLARVKLLSGHSPGFHSAWPPELSRLR